MTPSDWRTLQYNRKSRSRLGEPGFIATTTIHETEYYRNVRGNGALLKITFRDALDILMKYFREHTPTFAVYESPTLSLESVGHVARSVA